MSAGSVRINKLSLGILFFQLHVHSIWNKIKLLIPLSADATLIFYVKYLLVEVVITVNL